MAHGTTRLGFRCLVVAAVAIVAVGCSRDSIESVSSAPSTVASTSPSTTAVPATTAPPTTAPATTEAPADSTTTSTTVAPTTTTAPPSNDELPGVPVLYEFECRDGFLCTQFDEAPSGAIIATELDGTSLRRYEPDRVVDIEVVLPEGLAFGAGAALMTVGPDDVAYVVVEQVPYVDPIQDLLAVATTGPRAGDVVASWEGVLDGSGDTDYVTTAEGLVPVGCCNFDAIRPDPTSPPTVSWVDSTGEPTTSSGPFATITTGDGGNTLTIADGDATSVYPLSIFAQFMRGMAPVDVLDDGRVVMRTFEMGAWVTTLYTPDDAGQSAFVGAGETIVEATWSAPATDAQPFVLEVLRSGDVLAVVAGELRQIPLDDTGERGWNDTARSRDWQVTADGLNEFIDSEQPQWAADPFVFGAMLVQSWYPNEQTLVEVPDPSLDPFDPDGVDVGSTGDIVITTSGFLDDSVAASQWTITVEVADDGLLRFVSGTSAQRCQPGRGHQDFRPELCI